MHTSQHKAKLTARALQMVKLLGAEARTMRKFSSDAIVKCGEESAMPTG